MAGGYFYENESVLHHCGTHWIVFMHSLLLLLVAFIVYLSHNTLYEMFRYLIPTRVAELSEIKNDLPRWIDNFVTIFQIILCCFLGFAALIQTLAFFSVRLIITEKRLMRHNVILGKMDSFDVNAIESIRTLTGFLGTTFKYGTITFHLVSGNKVRLRSVSDPRAVERILFMVK